MAEIIGFMWLPFLACILLIGINSYFGLHVIKREIIFIDIALAQIAALGTTIALILSGQEHEEEGGLFVYLFTLGFTSLAALMFSLLKNKKIKIPLEALIGIAYAVATTAVVIILDKAAGGDVHVHDMLIGAILWVSPEQVIRLSITILLVGGFHFAFRKKFIALSQHYHDNNSGIKNPKLWDFLFYFSFGIVIVEAVRTGGILTVFAFLILPASMSAMISEKWSYRLFFGLIVGGLSTILGLYISWIMDVPCSPAIILFLGIALLIVVLFAKMFPKKTNGKV